MTKDVYNGIWGGKNCRDSPVQTNRECSCAANECKASENYVDQFKEVVDYCLPKGGQAAVK